MAKLHLGFTGTQRTLGPLQRDKVAELLRGFFDDGYVWLHHGDCIGADKFAHGCWRLELNGRVELHPAIIDPEKRAWCEWRPGLDIIHPPLPPLRRNRVIAACIQALLAAPNSMTEELRSGTWATIRYARQLARPIYIVLPNGAMRVEGQVPPP